MKRGKFGNPRTPKMNWEAIPRRHEKAAPKPTPTHILAAIVAEDEARTNDPYKRDAAAWRKQQYLQGTVDMRGLTCFGCKAEKADWHDVRKGKKSKRWYAICQSCYKKHRTGRA